MILSLKPVLVQREVKYECGCIAQKPVLGQFAGLGWHVVPCYSHSIFIAEIEKQAEIDWRLRHNEKL